MGERLKRVRKRLEGKVGGPARLRIILLLSAVLGLDTADKAAVSAVAGSLKEAFAIGNAELGILISIVSFVGAAATLPIGLLVDRVRRKRLLTLAIALWTLAMVASGFATSFVFLLITRVFLGLVAATAQPAVASLTGDFFPPRERARIYGLILAGELVGTGFGFLLAGEISSWLHWRAAFFALAVPSGALAWVVHRHLPEPARGGQSWLQPGQQDAAAAEKVDSEPQQRKKRPVSGKAELAQQTIKEAHIEPHRDLVLHRDPAERSLWWAFRYVLRIRTNVLLIIASALGYYFFAGVRAFGMIYITEHYGLARSTASTLILVLGVGALAGVTGGGRLADHLLRRGWLSARVLIPGATLLLAALFFAPAIWTTSIPLAIFLFTLGFAAIAAANPPLDAARLDIMHPRLWGRAEAVRTVLRMSLEGTAPMLFGLLSETVFGGGETGLKWTFLLMLAPLAGAGFLALPARRSYPRDVATAAASVKATTGAKDGTG